MSRLNDERELLSRPGDTIVETMEHLKMSNVELAKIMERSLYDIKNIISGEEPITADTATLLEKALGIDAQFWLNREKIYREKLSKIEQGEGSKK